MDLAPTLLFCYVLMPPKTWALKYVLYGKLLGKWFKALKEYAP